MYNTEVPLEIIVPIAVAMAGAITALWVRDGKREQYARELYALLLKEISASREVNATLRATIDQAMQDNARSRVDQNKTDRSVIDAISSNSKQILSGIEKSHSVLNEIHLLMIKNEGR